MRKRWYVLAGTLGVLGTLMRYVFTAVRFCGFLCLCATVFFLAWGLLEVHQKKPAVHVVRQVLLGWVLVGTLLFVGLEVEVLLNSHTDYERTPQAVVVLGAGVNGRTPSLSLAVRLRACLQYIEDKPDIPIIVTGAQGPGEEITEAACMAGYLIDRGVEADRIYLEEQAVDTEENIRYSKAILETLGLGPDAQVAVVTSDYHLCRAKLYWDGEGFIPVAAHMPPGMAYLPLTVNYYIREAFGIAALRTGIAGALSGL